MATKTSFLAIEYSNELIDGQSIQISSNSSAIKATRYEPAGHAFHSAVLKLLGCDSEEDEKNQEETRVKEQSFTPSYDSYSTKGKKKSGDKQQDHYALLGLGHLRYLATEEQIRKSYREVALKYHPDKQAAIILAEETEAAKQSKKEEIESLFKSIQEAYEVLIDTLKRRIYDSTDEFDDEIPSDCAPQDFFKVFGPAFVRNGRWSVNQQIPNLGDENTSIKEVDSFYNFWYGFRSWREFPHADEYDVEQAESRDHKRWMERQNAKLSEKARKEEYARVRTLVDNAYRRDPRIQRRKEDEKAEKQRKKDAKLLAKKLQEEEAAKAAEEEKLRREEEERIAAEAALLQKKAKEKEKKLLRKERTRFRTLCSAVANVDVDALCTSFDLERLKAVCDELEGKSVSEQAEILRNAGSGSGTEKQNGEVPLQNGHSEIKLPIEKTEKPWEKEEIEMLRKGMVKYPKGTSRRWEVISEYVGTGRSVEEILKATKTVLLQKPDNSKAFDSFLEKRKPVQPIASALSTRADVEGASNPEVDGGKSEGSSSGDVSAEDTWTAVQEKALVQALKTFSKETNQRWERVAAAVPGKTVNQCKKKYTVLKESFRSKKTAA